MGEHFDRVLMISITDDKGERQLFDVPGRMEEKNQEEAEDGGESSMWIPSDLSQSEEEVTEPEISQESMSHAEVQESPGNEPTGELCLLVLANFTTL